MRVYTVEFRIKTLTAQTWIESNKKAVIKRKALPDTIKVIVLNLET